MIMADVSGKRNYLLIGLLLLAIMSLLLSLPGCAAPQKPQELLTPEERRWLEEHADEVTIVTTANWAPYEYFDENGNLQGYVADYIRLLEKKINFRFKIVPTKNWAESIALVLDHKAGLITSITHTPDREEKFGFAGPYRDVPVVIITRDNMQKSLTLDEMNGLKVAIVRGYFTEALIRAQYPHIILVPVDNENAGVRMVSFGEADAFVADVGTVSFYAEKNAITNLRVAGETGFSYVLHFGVRSDWPVLRGIMQKGVDAISAEENNQLYNNWVSLRQKSMWETREFWLVVGEVIALALIAFLIMGFWNITLKREVRQRTQELHDELAERLRINQALKVSEEKYRRANEDLISAHEELAASEEELRQQFLALQKQEEEISRQNAALRISEANYRTIFETSNDSIFIHDPDTGEILDVNENALATFGWSREDLLAKSLDSFMAGEAPFSAKEAREAIMRAAGGEPQLFEWQNKDSAGIERWQEVRLKRAKLENEDCIIAIVRDISERKKQEIELQKSRDHNQSLINAIPDPMFIIRTDGLVVDYIPSKEHPQMQPAQFVGRSICEIFPEEVGVKTRLSIKNALQSGTIQVFEYTLPADGKTEYHEMRIVARNTEEALAIDRNITDRKNMEIQLEHLSLHDALTGLYNRAFFEEEMRRLEGVRSASVGLIICDVDGLKIINDTLGHSTGDLLLKAVADIIKKSFRPSDLTARIGGDEFAVLIYGKGELDFKNDCRRIQDRIEIYNAANPTLPISLSTGYAVSAQSPVDMKTLFKEADNNMYREKLHRQKSARSAIVQALLQALEARDFQTEGHGDRLQNLIEGLAREINMPETNIADLRLLARFHDIGKVGIPDSILFKPGRLTDEEMVVMRQHCEIGYRIAKSAPDLVPIADWILKHQEWYNGKGYPLGIAGNDIPLECRMISIVDAFDAMTSDRPYRKALSTAAALAELKRCAGTQFDPELVAKFCAMKRYLDAGQD